MHSSAKKIAKQRVQVLFELANVVYKANPELSRHHVGTAKKIAMAAKIRLPPDFRRRTCKNCNSLLLYGENCRVRIRQKRESHVVITCLSCGYQVRTPLKKHKERVEIE